MTRWRERGERNSANVNRVASEVNDAVSTASANSGSVLLDRERLDLLWTLHLDINRLHEGAITAAALRVEVILLRSTVQRTIDWDHVSEALAGLYSAWSGLESLALELEPDGAPQERVVDMRPQLGTARYKVAIAEELTATESDKEAAQVLRQALKNLSALLLWLSQRCGEQARSRLNLLENELDSMRRQASEAENTIVVGRTSREVNRAVVLPRTSEARGSISAERGLSR